MEPAAAWSGYGRAVVDSMGEVLVEIPDDHHGVVLETADYWLSVGLSIGLEHPVDAKALLDIVEGDPEALDELRADAQEFLAMVLGR